MTPRGRRILWGMIAAGVVVRTVVAFATVGVEYDIQSLHLVADRLQAAHPFALYADLNAGVPRWPYPSGYFPWALFSDWVGDHTALPFHGVIQVPMILFDAALAWIVQAYLAGRGASERTRLVAAGLVAFGPVFAFVSGYLGQIDAAVMPAAAALLVWQRMAPGKRALPAGLLIGAGAALKTVPGLAVLALLPRCSGRREAAVLLGATVAVPLVLMLPWLVAEPRATADSFGYSGVPGIGGLSLLAQPDLIDNWLLHGGAKLSGLSNALLDVRGALTIVAVGGVAALLFWRRPEPAQGATLIWLAVFASALNFGPRYVVWGLPFMLMAGYLKEVALIQAVAFPAAVILAFRTYDEQWIAVVYVILMLALLVGFAIWLALLAARLVRARPAGFEPATSASGGQRSIH